MDAFKFLLGFCCIALVSIRQSEAQGTWSSSGAASVSITEGTTIGTAVAHGLTFSGGTGTITYTINSVTPSAGTNLFSVTSTSGAIATAGSFCDTTTASYAITLRSTDSASPANTVDATVTVTVTVGGTCTCSGAGMIYPSVLLLSAGILGLLLKFN